ncbi:MAG: class I SAM-dependent methyltransferase [Oscillospiraceae bacterium]|nr:class I SAM-dependent methyltransferase [Oscillospiraceae bacterium]
MSQESIIDENRAYWTRRAPGYSQVNRLELRTLSRRLWLETLEGQLQSQFPDRAPETLRVLEVGTGPGFFAILLAGAGYAVTAVDLTPSMLEEAKENAGPLAEKIEFLEMNAEALTFADASFDAVVSRNLTWDLPHPETAYREWRRVLRPGGLLLNFDANWYGYLFDEEAREAYETDRRNTAEKGMEDGNIGPGFDVMEDIARRVPLSRLRRPAWDERVLTSLGFRVDTDEEVWRRVWSEEEKVNYASTPLFLIRAVREG